MKYILIIILIVFVLNGCAATKPGHDTDYKNGIEYSVQSFSQPIDILNDEPFYIPIKNARNKLNKGKTPQQTQLAKRKFGIQIASFNNEMNAKDFLENVVKNNLKYRFRIIYSKNLWRIVIGNYSYRLEAEGFLNDIRNSGFQDAWIIQF